ncbi:MAG: four helix bundle protein [Betaproteobacteria bacterium]|nr:four helix bundle protein [Betaproteobacteria bacterium]
MDPRDLLRRTKRFALNIISLYTDLPKSTVAQVLGRQLLRSGTSVGAQYREARRAKSVADFISKMEGALQELEETGYWLELLGEPKTVTQTEIQVLRNEVEELISMLVASVRTAKRRKRVAV